jgi:hypothetical protein
LELKDETIDCLQGNVSEMNLNLLTTVKMLKGKEQLIQNLQSQNTELQRQLESEVISKLVTFLLNVPYIVNCVILK